MAVNVPCRVLTFCTSDLSHRGHHHHSVLFFSGLATSSQVKDQQNRSMCSYTTTMFSVTTCMHVVKSIVSYTLATSSGTAFAFYCARRVEIDVLGIAEELSPYIRHSGGYILPACLVLVFCLVRRDAQIGKTRSGILKKINKVATFSRKCHLVYGKRKRSWKICSYYGSRVYVNKKLSVLM